MKEPRTIHAIDWREAMRRGKEPNVVWQQIQKHMNSTAQDDGSGRYLSGIGGSGPDGQFSPVITAADVVAFLADQCADVRRLTGCKTATVNCYNRVSSPAELVDHFGWTVHAHGECECDHDLEVAKSRLLSKLGRPAELAARRRAEAAKLLAEADALEPTKNAADFEREAARENPEAYVR